MNTLSSGVRRLLLTVVALCALTTTVLAQAPQTGSPERPFTVMLAGWTRTLDRVTDVSTRPNLVPAEIEQLRLEAIEVRDAASAAAVTAREELVTLQTLLAKVEPVAPPDAKPGERKPRDGRADEPEDIRLERERLRSQVSLMEGRARQAELATARAELLIQQLSRLRDETFVRTLMRKMPSPFRPSTWQQAWTDAGDVIVQQRASFSAWLSNGPIGNALAVLPMALIGAIATVALWWWIRRLRARFGRDSGIAEPNYRQRVAAAALDGIGSVAAPLLAVIFIVAMCQTAEQSNTIVYFLNSFGGAVFVALLISGIGESALAPMRPKWRIAGLNDDSARRLSQRLQWFAWCSAGMLAFYSYLLPPYPERPALKAVVTLLFLLGTVPLLIPVFRASAWHHVRASEGTTVPLSGGMAWKLGRGVICLIAAAALAVAVLGYANLGFHVYDSLFSTLITIALAIAGRQVFREVLETAAAPDTPSGRWIRTTMGMEAEAPLKGRLLLVLAFDLAMVTLLSAILPALWGVPYDESADWVWRLLTGLKIGGHTISLVAIFIGIAVFVIAVAVLQFLRRAVRDRVLPSMDLNQTMQYTVDAGLNYLGIIVAALLGITALGVDFSNLALIVSALSVGIGLGLQGIANNTISGIILLVERPIKVGDWVTVGRHEGSVKRINIRATELQTGQRASVIVPNSEFLQTAVINWTYADNMSRVDIAITVVYGSDLAKVEVALMKAATDNPLVATTPKPFTVFSKIAANGLEWELRCFLRNIATTPVARTQLNHAVLTNLAEAGIDISVTAPPAPAPVPA